MPRLSLVLDVGIVRYFAELAHEHKTDFSDLLERGVRTLALVREQRAKGLPHFGMVADPSKLDAELRGLFPEQPHIIVM